MESQNLQAASTYVNNILLARGLLKGGRAIDFADPENEDGGTDATMARVINLVNDLVLRRDRESEHRESLSTTIRTLQATETEQTNEIGKLKTKTSEMTRSLALAEAQERTLKSNVSSAEATIRGMKEQVQRMKSTVTQVRAQCANDIRKRDLEMQKLKSHLADRQRGKREGLGVTTININPTADRSRLGASGGDRINDPGYSLKQETTDFLTELCQNLSDENDTLIELARNTVHTLKDLQGLPQAEATQEAESAGMGASVIQKPATVTSLPTSCEELSVHMETVLDHLRTLLTNPSFVPLEEVEVRDEEIKRLRAGWVKMESRWTQAVTMMGGWQRRLADGGSSIQAEELKHGMNLDLSINSAGDTSMQSADSNSIPTILEDQDEEQDSHDPEPDTEQKAPEPEISNPRTRTKIRKVPERPDRVLRERNDNSMAKRPRKVSFTPGLQGSPAVENVEDETLEMKALKTENVTRRPTRRKTNSKETHQLNKESLSVQQKLAAVEDEARAAQSERKERESRKRSHPDKASRPPNRRRSTLTTDELDDLMGVAR
ncbi:Afadin/alpha-actinin-binding [Penicillium brevicompactum]|uniref:Afadin/alpha-actinin-binding n=1 Tax=Penicillium brevicompactum TaxID=5074 RepID=A0A9W9QPL1_PENBR|nr:Afadin/alpha-actinin-binding [Penicillium brevicompactum]